MNKTQIVYISEVDSMNLRTVLMVVLLISPPNLVLSIISLTLESLIFLIT